MIDYYETYICSECGSKHPSNVGNPLHGADGEELCSDCIQGYVPKEQRTCVLCGDTNPDTTVELKEYKTEYGIKPVCDECICHSQIEEKTNP